MCWAIIFLMIVSFVIGVLVFPFFLVGHAYFGVILVPGLIFVQSLNKLIICLG